MIERLKDLLLSWLLLENKVFKIIYYNTIFTMLDLNLECLGFTLEKSVTKEVYLDNGCQELGRCCTQSQFEEPSGLGNKDHKQGDPPSK